VNPEYSDEARAARYSGTVVLEIVVRKDGTVDVVRVVRPLGLGLDEQAVKAVKQWRFKPGMRDGQPVDVTLHMEVSFNLQ
jgi:TonB family protein